MVLKVFPITLKKPNVSQTAKTLIDQGVDDVSELAALSSDALTDLLVNSCKSNGLITSQIKTLVQKMRVQVLCPLSYLTLACGYQPQPPIQQPVDTNLGLQFSPSTQPRSVNVPAPSVIDSYSGSLLSGAQAITVRAVGRSQSRTTPLNLIVHLKAPLSTDDRLHQGYIGGGFAGKQELAELRLGARRRRAAPGRPGRRRAAGGRHRHRG